MRKRAGKSSGVHWGLPGIAQRLAVGLVSTRLFNPAHFFFFWFVPGLGAWCPSRALPHGKRFSALKQTKHIAFGVEKRLKQGWFKSYGTAASRGANHGVLQMSRMRAAYDAFRNYRVHRMAERALSAMDDALLRDIGISRSEIGSVVRGLNRSPGDKAG